MLKWKFSLSILFLSVLFFCRAQTDEPQVRDYTKKHLISVNVGNLLIGDASIYYEQNIMKHFNLSGAAGITFFNIMYNTFTIHSERNLLSGTITPPTPFDSGFERLGRLGATFMIEPKYYFGKKDSEGFYVGLQYRFRKYNYYSAVYDNNYSDDEFTSVDLAKPIKEYRAVSDFLVELGGSHFKGKHFNYQYYIGMGLRNNNCYSATMNITVDGNENITSYQLSEAKSNLMRFAVTGGLRLGYVF
jgi:hypothetical protein